MSLTPSPGGSGRVFLPVLPIGASGLPTPSAG